MSGHLLAQQSPLFDGVEPQVVSALLASARRRSFARGEPIAFGGLLFVFSGAVKIFYATAGGAQVMLKLVRAGEVFAALPGSSCEEQAQALDACDVMLVGRVDFFEALEQSHRLTYNALRLASARCDDAAAVIRSFAFSSVEDRLGDLLASLADAFGRAHGHGTRIELPLSQDALAELLGAGRRSVTRAISRWSRTGALKKKDGRFVIGAELSERRRSFA